MALIRTSNKAVTDMLDGIHYEYYSAGAGHYVNQAIASGTAINVSFGYGFSFIANCKNFTDLNSDNLSIAVGFKDGVGTQINPTSTTHYNLTDYDYVYGTAAKSSGSSTIALTFT